MTEQPSAIIIPFPSRVRPTELAQSVERLAQSLSALSEALVEQREATSRWRAALQALGERVGQGATSGFRT